MNYTLVMLSVERIADLACSSSSSTESYQRLLLALREEFNGDVAMLHVSAAYPITRCGPVATVGFDPERMRATARRWPVYVGELEPLRKQATQSSPVVSDIEVFSRCVLQDKTYYKELTVPEGGVESLVAYLPWRGQATAAVMLGSRKRRFSNAARAALSEMTPILSLVVAAAPATRKFYPPGAHLTPREQQLVGYVEAGLTNTEIATCLGSSLNTVRNQIASILRKLELASRVELAASGLGRFTVTHR